MGIALFTLTSLFAPLQAFFAPVSRSGAAREAVCRSATLPRASAPASCQRQATVKTRPLRVVRVVEPEAQRACAGRMVISGRMADVCAELDRLADIEAASQVTRH